MLKLNLCMNPLPIYYTNCTHAQCPCFRRSLCARYVCGDSHTVPRLSSLQELLSLSELAHYHLVRLYGVSPNGSISIVSEFVPGGPLDAYLQDKAATVSGGDMLSYALQVAKVSAVGRWARQEVDGAGGKEVGGERRSMRQEGGGWGRREAGRGYGVFVCCCGRNTNK